MTFMIIAIWCLCVALVLRMNLIEKELKNEREARQQLEAYYIEFHKEFAEHIYKDH